MANWAALILSASGWTLAVLISVTFVLTWRKWESDRQTAVLEATSKRDASNAELATLRRALETAQREASSLRATLSDFNAHVVATRIASSAFLDEMHRRLEDRLELLQGIYAGLAPAKQELEAEIKSTTLHDRRERFSKHLADAMDGEAYLEATIPLRKQNIEALEAFRTKLAQGRFDEAFEESNFEKLMELLERLDQEQRRALLEGIKRPGHLEFSNALKFRAALEKTIEEKRLEADIKAQKSRSVLDN